MVSMVLFCDVLCRAEIRTGNSDGQFGRETRTEISDGKLRRYTRTDNLVENSEGQLGRTTRTEHSDGQRRPCCVLCVFCIVCCWCVLRCVLCVATRGGRPNIIHTSKDIIKQPSKLCSVLLRKLFRTALSCSDVQEEAAADVSDGLEMEALGSLA